jgi:hypothetical protein
MTRLITKLNLVISQAAGYTFDQVEPFLRSLKQTGFDGSVVFFILESDKILRQRLERSGIVVVVYRNDYPFFVDRTYHNLLALPSDRRSWPPVSLRFLLYEVWLIAHGIDYDWILHSDVRDVIFQRDPFEDSCKKNGMHIFLESQHVTFGTERSNAVWVEACFGKSALLCISSRRIACAGVMLGSSLAWLMFLRAFNSILIDCGYSIPGADQGVLNGLLYLEPKT